MFIFSRTTGSISTKPGVKHPWMMGILIVSNERPGLFPRGDNYEIALTKFKNLLPQNYWAKSNEEPFNSNKGKNEYFLLLINDLI